MSISLGIVGATGSVGEVFLKLLEERKFNFNNLRLFASDRSQGTVFNVRGKNIAVETLCPGCFSELDLVFFSSGDEISREWAPLAAQSGAYAIDNSAAFRMDPNIPLIVPEVNGGLLKSIRSPQIISNPNCSTIQLAMALKPLADKFGLDQVQVATYQAVSGAGKSAQEELMTHTRSLLNDNKRKPPEQFARSIPFNCIPQIGRLDEDGLTTEEQKIRRETKKILGLSDLKVSAWTVRVPVVNGHSEACWIRLKSKVTLEEIRTALQSFGGLRLCDDFPTALDASGENDVLVGRIHRDSEDELTWKFWIVADNLRKGAALNAIQIAETLF